MPERNHRRPYQMVLAAIGVLALLLFGLHAGYWRLQQDTMLSGSGDGLTPVSQDQATSAVPGVGPTPLPPTREDKIQELLGLARQDIAALRLMTPENNNAYDKFLRVLALDQSNMAAVRGIDSITDKYLELVYEDIKTENLDRAGQYLEKADYLRPGQPKIVTARKALVDAVRERDRAASVMGRFRRAMGGN